MTAGCGTTPPDTSPAVSIVSPVNNTPVPAGQAITVDFQIGGFDVDPNTGMSVPFTLNPLGMTKVIGQGRVAAFYGNNGAPGQVVVGVDANPSQLSITFPQQAICAGEPYCDATTLITAGTGIISLYLQYNDAPNYTFVEPQRSAQVSVTVYSP